MGKRSPLITKKKTSKNANPADKSNAEVMRLLDKFSRMLVEYREREGLDQKAMAEKLDIGQSRYNEIEKLRNLNPAFGVSLALLQRFAQLERMPISSVIEKMEGRHTKPAGRELLSDTLIEAFDGLSFGERDQFNREIMRSGSPSIPNKLKWWVNLGLDLFSMKEKDQLEFEMSIHQYLLKSLGAKAPDSQERRARTYAIMKEILESNV
jgi:transcriptional regulator with XRE-family HTH domain